MSIRFGQEPSLELYLEPEFGQGGTCFSLKAIRLDPGSKVRVLIEAPKKKRLFLALKKQYIYDATVQADNSGNVSVETIAMQNWEPGIYTFVVTGLSHNKP